ncbi:hypothetical protein VM1G_03626 [Cytospora mali]|uniref:DUF2470 domain-containing protein n=1 Tax=Cytospora mali TaxID=578113 RepID=A0A194VVX2_CYTMA|nr:hypothetical protein VM1G_03626 [Valsa mali]
MVVTRSASRSQRATPTAQPPSTTTSTTLPTPTTPTTTPSSTAADVDPVTKSRTIAHMNKDHTEDMSIILQHRAGLSVSEASNAELLDLDLTTLKIRSASGVHTVTMTPPMDTWNDRRERLADMATEARKALGRETAKEAGQAPSSGAPAQIRFYAPRGSDWFAFIGVTFYYVCAVLVYAGFVMPGSPAWRLLELVRFPDGPVRFIWLVKKILVLVLGIHAVEGFWLDRSRLAPSGLRRGSIVWFLWMGAAFFEGVPAFGRWDRLVKGKGLKTE